MSSVKDGQSVSASHDGQPRPPDPRSTRLRWVSIVVPIYNEENSIDELVHRLASVADAQSHRFEMEFILVDDGSSDGSVDCILRLIKTQPRLKLIRLRRNYGQTAALQAGFDSARGDIVISMDGDLQHFPEDIPAFLEKIETGADVVCGWRYVRRENILRRWPSRAANYLLRLVSGVEVHDIGTTFRAYRREILEDIQLLGENHRFVPIFAQVAGARLEEIPISNIERPHGQSNYGLSRTINVGVDIFFLLFFVRYLDRPMRPFGKMSLLLFGTASMIAVALAIVWIGTGRSVVREHSGWFISALFLYISALQTLLTGIIAEILVRVYFSRDSRPSYRIRDVWPEQGASGPPP